MVKISHATGTQLIVFPFDKVDDYISIAMIIIPKKTQQCVERILARDQITTHVFQ